MPECPDLIDLVGSHESVRGLARALSERRRAVAAGPSGSGAALVAGAVARQLGAPVVLVVAHLDDVDEAGDEIEQHGVPVIRLPALESLPGEAAPAWDLVAERLTACRRVAGVSGACVVVCSVQSLMQSVPRPEAVAGFLREIRVGTRASPTELGEWLSGAGYSRVEAVEEPGDYAVRGGILDVFPAGGGEAKGAVRLDFFGDEVERITEIDVETLATDRTVSAVELVSARPEAAGGEGGVNFLELAPRSCVVLLAETMEIVEQGRGYYERVTDARGIYAPPAVLQLAEMRFHALAELNQFSAGAATADVRMDVPIGVLPAFPGDAGGAIDELSGLAPGGRVLVCCQTPAEQARFAELSEGRAGVGGVECVLRYLHRGFTIGGAGAGMVALVPYHELLGRFGVRRRTSRVRASRAMDTFLDFDPGEFVVHAEHGIARFVGLSVMKPREVPAHVRAGEQKREPDPEEYLTLEFAGRTRLHVPASQVDKVQKYIGGFAGKPPLSTLGGQKWKSQKERVASSVKDLAAELMRVRAAREAMPGISYPPDTEWQREFEAEFPYEETEDQTAALAEIKKDMQRARPMDRLLCGDVGFGKTELAIRAAFKAVEFGRQVAVLVPTTVLAEQHERTFGARFAGYPFRVESLSRFKTDAEVRSVLERLRRGEVDVVIGTHRLLSQDVHFADLGLVIVDEEQRFGVEHKEALLRLRLTVDVLTLSATPIPRTLHMAMLGIRDISSLATAPVDRRAIVTEVIPWNAVRVRQAIERELAREGQVFYVHNRVHDIRSKADDIRRLVPEARIVIGHGQMPPHELEEVMLRFIRRQADILVSTTIIESGIDIPTANTMIIDDADRFGLAELHQLRGRVGRSRHRAYCYLLLPPERTVKEVAQKRLKAIEQYSMLGAGFKIAMRDLEIRGAGNILGSEQSGHIAVVGYEMYCRLLEEAVHRLQNERPPEPSWATSVEIGVSGMIPRAYIPSDKRRLGVYRRLATSASLEDIERLRRDLAEAYGEPPTPAQRLLDLAELRVAVRALGVRTVTIRDRDVLFLAEHGGPVAEQLRKGAAGPKDPATIRTLPPQEGRGFEEVYFRPPESYLEPTTLLAVLRRRLGCAGAEGAPASKRGSR